MPTLAVSDIPKEAKNIPTDVSSVGATQVLTHDIATSEILYAEHLMVRHRRSPLPFAVLVLLPIPPGFRSGRRPRFPVALCVSPVHYIPRLRAGRTEKWAIARRHIKECYNKQKHRYNAARGAFPPRARFAAVVYSPLPRRSLSFPRKKYAKIRTSR